MAHLRVPQYFQHRSYIDVVAQHQRRRRVPVQAHVRQGRLQEERVERATDVRRVGRRAEHGREHEPAVRPGVTRGGFDDALPFLMRAERGQRELQSSLTRLRGDGAGACNRQSDHPRFGSASTIGRASTQPRLHVRLVPLRVGVRHVIS